MGEEPVAVGQSGWAFEAVVYQFVCAQGGPNLPKNAPKAVRTSPKIGGERSEPP